MDEFQPQRIVRLTPLAEVLGMIDALVQPVAARMVDTAAALGRILAADVAADAAWPPRALALRDGWALEAAAVADASPYAPALLPAAPPRVDVGEPLPAGFDAVAPLDAVLVRSGLAEVLAPVAPGEGVLAAGTDAAAAAILKRAGERLGRADLATLAACGVARVSVRVPRVAVVAAGTPGRPIDAALALLAGAIAAGGGTAEPAGDRDLADVLQDDGMQAVIAVGGTGSGRHDRAVATLARAGRVACHGIGLQPGETAAFGFVGARPVLLLPGRLDAALAGWLAIGRPLLARLAGGADEADPPTARLSRKVSSALGFAEAVPVRRTGDIADPLAGAYWPHAVLARANGWILVPADSEGYPAGTRVAVRAWP